jgi:hypothetical protein
MEGAYYKENLYDINQLKEELDIICNLSTDVSRYSKTLYRGFDNGFEPMKTHSSFEDAKRYVDDILLWHEGKDTNGNSFKNMFGQLCLNGGELNWNDFPLTHNWIVNKSFELFNQYCKNKNKFFIGNPLLTLYTKGCLLSGHKDGKPDGYENFQNQKPANILIYLNKEYKKEYGGLFVVEDEEIIPEFADIIFLNFSGDSDPFHMVREVTQDVNRFALLFNVQYSK